MLKTLDEELSEDTMQKAVPNPDIYPENLQPKIVIRYFQKYSLDILRHINSCDTINKALG